MNTTFRACYFVAANGQSDMCLTSEDQAHLTDAQLIEAAVAEAREAGLVGDDEHQVAEEDLRAGLHIGEYTA